MMRTHSEVNINAKYIMEVQGALLKNMIVLMVAVFPMQVHSSTGAHALKKLVTPLVGAEMSKCTNGSRKFGTTALRYITL